MEYEGVVYRPPSEADSLIIQATVGCAHNTCTFCTMYKDKKFHTRPLDAIFRDIDEMKNEYAPYVKKVFLADGDALVLKTETLIAILEKLKKSFPHLKRTTSYGTTQDILLKTDEELSDLRKHGLEMVYLGAESGSDDVLNFVHKDVSADEIIEAGKKLKCAKIKSSITLISGLGGKANTTEHAKQSAHLISEIKPEYCAFLSLQIFKSTPLFREIENGNFTPLDAREVMNEMKIFLQNVDSEGTVFRSNHASNVALLAGTLNKDIPDLIATIDEVQARELYRTFNHPVL